jgi:hypothetical protein
MKKELQMTIKKSGILNRFICDLISSYNEGKGSYTLTEINAILKGKKIEFPHTLENLSTIHLGDEIIISENGKDVSVIIEERELMILNENITDEISELG